MSMMGVPSKASRSRTSTRGTSIAAMRTGCSALGFGLSWDRVQTTPLAGFRGRRAAVPQAHRPRPVQPGQYEDLVADREIAKVTPSSNAARRPALPRTPTLEEADDLAVLVDIRGHPIPGLRRQVRRGGLDDGMEPLGQGAIRSRHRGDLFEHGLFPGGPVLLPALLRPQLPWRAPSSPPVPRPRSPHTACGSARCSWRASACPSLGLALSHFEAPPSAERVPGTSSVKTAGVNWMRLPQVSFAWAMVGPVTWVGGMVNSAPRALMRS